MFELFLNCFSFLFSPFFFWEQQTTGCGCGGKKPAEDIIDVVHHWCVLTCLHLMYRLLSNLNGFIY